MPYTTINKGSSYFDTKLYTGTGTTQSVTGLAFQPDLVWIKDRVAADYHWWTDAVRGATKTLHSNVSTAETTQATSLTAFGSSGFTLGSDASVNRNGDTFVSWNWLANNTSGSSNTAGTITSTVAANTTAGFSIVTYTGAGGASTVGHGLGVAPKLIILKGRSNARIWVIGQTSLGWTKYMSFDSNAVETNNYWNDTAPTSSVFSVFNSVNVNGSGETYVAYCFAEIRGYSKFGTYTGNGDANGPFVYTGFKPAFLIIKQSSSAGENWYMWDNKRDTFNLTNKRLYPNLSNSEETPTISLDLLSNGFKPRSTYTGFNQSGGTFIYIAFAENPFVTSGGIPVTAR